MTRSSLLQIGAIAVAAIVGAILLLVGADIAALFVLGLGIAFVLLISALLAAVREARLRKVERDLLRRISYLEKVTTRAEWRAGESSESLRRAIVVSRETSRLKAIEQSLQHAANFIEEHAKRDPGDAAPRPSLSQRDVELLLVTLLSASTKER